ncbi:hypothetical protein HU200_029362 [Digitaria exilis]|uniref:Bifunctional inhibitor/plant lipid transfer protein/seed storage helical domain-containing protein n=1 Tax=Digitaria exilis TaxID=1010633 RepID=A0A835BTR2_9POAL|nr:hypothetical protein HU200_029362 [Digitaria exilis]
MQESSISIHNNIGLVIGLCSHSPISFKISIGKAAVLLLLVFATIFLDPVAVSGGCGLVCPKPKLPCTETQKNYIVRNVCNCFVLSSNPSRILPAYDDSCCRSVRTLQSGGVGTMQCIIDLLTASERRVYDVSAMLNLKTHCTQRPSVSSPVLPENEVKIVC